YEYDGGVMITASHNPPEFNGIKCMDDKGMELSPENEIEIEKIYWKKSFKQADWKSIGGITKSDYTTEYVSSIVSRISSSAIKRSNLKVVVDCVNGAACPTTPRILDELGCDVVPLNAQPSGEPSRPFEPTIQNVEGLMLLTKTSKADLGIAHDGDADRTIFVDENGDFVYGDRTLALIAKDIVAKNKGLVVTPVSSSQCVEDVVLEAGGDIHYTKVGAPLVARTMFEKGAVFGGEENGGMIFPKHQYCRDGAMAAARILEIMAKRKKKLSALLREIPHYEQFKTKVHCPDGAKKQVIKKLTAALKKKGSEISTIDGIKLFDKKGWVLIRPSGTEPIVRIFSEGKTKKNAKGLAEEGRGLLQDCIKASTTPS
ncbi:MAG: phosphoglucosamine mutase, partial [Thermoplasmata archaeon]|nr:phosphoglucosamine mutase [Thermoplasmata archaeon]